MSLSADPQDRLWQDNKVRNHALALPHLDGMVIRPGETFSFWRLVGPPVARQASHSFDPFPDQGRVIPYGTGTFSTPIV